MRSLLIRVVVVESVVDAIAQQSMASLLSLARECLLIVYVGEAIQSRKNSPHDLSVKWGYSSSRRNFLKKKCDRLGIDLSERP